MISLDTIDKVKELSIVDVVSKFMDIKKAGPNWRAASPWSNEKTPSFYVVPQKGIFKCFSTGKGGDGITFVMEKEGLSYPDAIKTLCAEFHISIQYESNGHTKEHYDELERLHKVNQLATEWYQELLWDAESDGAEHPAFRELISKRTFTADTIIQWKIGLSPDKWNFLAQRLINAGFYKEGCDLGLIKTKNDVNFDTFRNRVMYPIIDHTGRNVGFGGRALKSDVDNAKYINSSESKVFYKSTVLYGLNYAMADIKKRGFVNIMEGYTDVISFHQAGHGNTVGCCGTALTDQQAKLLKRYTNNAILIYDPDEAGQNAAVRAISMLTRFGIQCAMVQMPSVITCPNFREAVIVKSKTKDRLIYTYCNEEFDVALATVQAIEKVDPDELVRILH